MGAGAFKIRERRRGDAPVGEPGGWAQQWFAFYPRPCLILGRRLQVLDRNAAAGLLLETETTLQVRDGVLWSRDRKAQLMLEDAVRLATAGDPLRRILFGAGAPSVLKFVAFGEGEAAPVAMTIRSTEQQNLVCADLGEPFGLTQGEQRVVERLLRGSSSQEIADALGKSVLTVRTHIKRAYAKLSVTTREQLFARLLPFLDT